MQCKAPSSSDEKGLQCATLAHPRRGRNGKSRASGAVNARVDWSNPGPWPSLEGPHVLPLAPSRARVSGVKKIERIRRTVRVASRAPPLLVLPGHPSGFRRPTMSILTMSPAPRSLSSCRTACPARMINQGIRPQRSHQRLALCNSEVEKHKRNWDCLFSPGHVRPDPERSLPDIFSSPRLHRGSHGLVGSGSLSRESGFQQCLIKV